jgi:hypothetical protein
MGSAGSGPTNFPSSGVPTERRECTENHTHQKLREGGRGGEGRGGEHERGREGRQRRVGGELGKFARGFHFPITCCCYDTKMMNQL